jgi:hypothetical protein
LVTGQVAAREAPRRSDAGRIRLTGRDVSGLLLCAEHYAAPYDLLAGGAATGTVGPGPAWCWLTPERDQPDKDLAPSIPVTSALWGTCLKHRLCLHQELLRPFGDCLRLTRTR